MLDGMEVDDRVRVTHGHYQGREGTIRSIDGGQALVGLEGGFEPPTPGVTYVHVKLEHLEPLDD